MPPIMQQSPSRKSRKKPETGRVFEWSQTLDGARLYPADGMDFEELRSLVRAAEQGDYANGLSAFVQLEERDPHLASVANTRRLAVTGLEWEIVSASDEQMNASDRDISDKAAAYVRERFSRLTGLKASLKHMADAIGLGMAVCELEWGAGSELVDIFPIPRQRLGTDGRTLHVRVRTEEDHIGVLAESPKFVVHTPQSITGFAFERSLTRAVSSYVLAKFAAFTMWVMYCERFGMPFRVVKYPPKATNEEKINALNMLRNMGSFAYMLCSQAMQIEYVECTSRGENPFQTFIDYVDRKITIAFLGGHLAVDTTNATGTHAAGEVQNEVRKEIRNEDIANESETITTQVIAPMVAYKFPNLPEIATPIFRRRVPETYSRVEEGQVLVVATKQLGLPVEVSYALKRLGLPEPKRNALGRPVNELIRDPFDLDEGDGSFVQPVL